MKIYGVSQSSGVERQLRVERGIEGVVLTIIDNVGKRERERISVQGDNLVAAILDPSIGGSMVEGLPSPNGKKMQMEVEVRRNEVWLKMSSDSGDGSDIAVGFDDLQDALEGVISRT
jgi:hypothetical protein